MVSFFKLLLKNQEPKPHHWSIGPQSKRNHSTGTPRPGVSLDKTNSLSVLYRLCTSFILSLLLVV